MNTKENGMQARKSIRLDDVLDNYVDVFSKILGWDSATTIRNILIKGMITLVDEVTIPLQDIHKCTPRERQMIIGNIRSSIRFATGTYNRSFFLLKESHISYFLDKQEELNKNIEQMKGGIEQNAAR